MNIRVNVYVLSYKQWNPRYIQQLELKTPCLCLCLSFNQVNNQNTLFRIFIDIIKNLGERIA